MALPNGYLPRMSKRDAPVIDMTPDGYFIDRPKPSLSVIAARLAALGVILAVGAAAFWFALFIIPVLLILGLTGYAAAQFQRRRW